MYIHIIYIHDISTVTLTSGGGARVSDPCTAALVGRLSYVCCFCGLPVV